jgi:hypothetical protein
MEAPFKSQYGFGPPRPSEPTPQRGTFGLNGPFWPNLGVSTPERLVHPQAKPVVPPTIPHFGSRGAPACI